MRTLAISIRMLAKSFLLAEEKSLLCQVFLVGWGHLKAATETCSFNVKQFIMERFIMCAKIKL